jgi:CCCH-type zinc finger
VRRRDPVRGGERRNDEDYEGRRDGQGPMKMNVNTDRRAEPPRGKKVVKAPRQDKPQSEREGRADGSGGVGDSRGAGEEHEDRERESGENVRPRPSEFPLDSRDSSSEAAFTPLPSSSLVADSGEGNSSPIPSSSSALPTGSAPLEGSETKSSASAVVCRYYSKGMCMFGSKCDYIHSGVGGSKPLSRTPTQEEGAVRDDGQDAGSVRGDRVDKRDRAPGTVAGRGKGRESSTGRGRGGRGVKKTISALPIASSSDGSDPPAPATAASSAAPAAHAPISSGAGAEHDI